MKMETSGGPESHRPIKKRKYLILDTSPSKPAQSATPLEATPEELDRRALTWFGRSRRELVAEAAYYLALRRGFAGGDSERDWHEAEEEIEQRLRKGPAV
jgi:hypothetical protein